ncbi:hypothetical protein [Rhizobium leguminosarum]
MKIAFEDRCVSQEKECAILFSPIHAPSWKVLVTEGPQGAIYFLRLRPRVDMPFFDGLESTNGLNAPNLVRQTDKLVAFSARNEPEDADFGW